MTTISNWHRHYSTPHFTPLVIHGIETGEITSRMRQQIIQTLCVINMQHTFNPNPEQYSIVIQKLLESHPALTDEIGNGTYSNK